MTLFCFVLGMWRGWSLVLELDADGWTGWNGILWNKVEVVKI